MLIQQQQIKQDDGKRQQKRQKQERRPARLAPPVDKIGAQDAAAALVYQIANGSKQRGGGRADGQHGQAAHKHGQIEQHQIRKARERAHDPRIRIEKTHHDLTAPQPCPATGCAASGFAAP